VFGWELGDGGCWMMEPEGIGSWNLTFDHACWSSFLV
jgi:hypothetical protein